MIRIAFEFWMKLFLLFWHRTGIIVALLFICGYRWIHTVNSAHKPMPLLWFRGLGITENVLYYSYNSFLFSFILQINAACTFGAWHPLAAEKLMTFDMNSANDFSTFQSGIVRIRKPKSNGWNRFNDDVIIQFSEDTMFWINKQI